MKKTILIITAIFLANISKSQFFDNIGIRSGVVYSSQYYKFSDNIDTKSKWETYKIGTMVMLNIEKNINNHFSIKPEIGYISKGYISNTNLSYIKEDGTFANKKYYADETYHYLSSNLNIKYKIFNHHTTPYFSVGIRSEFLIAINGNKKIKELDEHNRYMFGGVIGVGYQYKNLMYLDIEYNPTFTNVLDNSELTIRDQMFSITIGININQMIINSYSGQNTDCPKIYQPRQN